MIKQYFLHNFKNHADTKLNLSALTLLTGMNGAGKSSIMQSMLLLRDTFFSTHQLTKLYLDGSSFPVGKTIDAVNWHCKKDKERLQYSFVMDDKSKLDFIYRYANNPDEKILILEKGIGIDNINTIPLFTDNFQYLSAFRYGPQSMYESDTEIVDSRRQLSKEKGRGEMTVYFLSKFGDESLSIDNLCYDKEESHTLRHQVMYWMNEISNGIELKIDQNGSNYKLFFGAKRKKNPTRYQAAWNTGYGISYVLPIVVAILSAKPGSLILIENPEAHIHPAGQSAMMRLISQAANAGVQVVIETHSDHIINGALVARKQNVISPDALTVYFFDIDNDLNALPMQLEIGKNGLIQHAPEKFFGQMNADLKVLFDMN